MTVLTPACGPTAPVVAGKDARAAVGQQTVTPGKGTLHSFTLHNTSGTAATQTIARLGLAFLKGGVPAGKRIAVRERGGQQVAFAAAAATNSWADGSLRSTADGGLVMIDGNKLDPGASRTYEVFTTNGPIATSGFDPFAWLAAHGNDLTVAVTARTGSATGAKPDLLFSLKTAIATTTRREILCDTRRFVRIKAWQKVPQEEHLICEYHLDFWLDGTGQPWGLEFAPVLTQHWWVADPFGTPQTKERQTYDAAVRYGTTVLDTRTRLDHAYHCRWASLRPQDDAQHARKHWIGLGLSQMPAVRVQYDDESLKRMMKAGYIPPLRLGVAYPTDFHAAPPVYGAETTGSSGAMQQVYTPLGRNGHRTGISGVGTYIGRGVWTDVDAKLVNRQGQAAATAELAWRRSRVMAQAALSIDQHWRDHRTASNVNGGTDTTNRYITQTFRKAAALSVSQDYTGLATHCVYSRGILEETTGLTVLAFAAPVGGAGVFSVYDTPHAHNYCGPTAFLEGEAYLGDAAISLMAGTTCPASNIRFNRYGSDVGPYYWGTARGTAQGVPTASGSGYGTTPHLTKEDRAVAWALNVLNHAYMVRADSHPEQPFLKNMVRNVDKWLSDSFGYFPEGHRTKGGAMMGLSARGQYSPWMSAWQGMVGYQSARIYDFLPDNARSMTGYEELAFLSARLVVAAVGSSPYGATAYHSMWATGASVTTFLAADEHPHEFSCNIASDVWTATPTIGMAWQNGDRLRVGGFNANFAAQTLPAGITEGTLYYLVNVSGNTFQVSLTDGGGAVTGIADKTALIAYISLQQHQTQTPIGPFPPYPFPNDDSTSAIPYALFEQAIGEGHPDIDQNIIDKGRAFWASKVTDFNNFSSWNYDGLNLH